MPESIESNPRRPTIGRAFLPLWIALSWAIAVLAREYHVRHAPLARLQLSVSIEGTKTDQFSVEVDGKPHDRFEPLPIGSDTIRIVSPGTEEYRVTRFVGYAPVDLGNVALSRSRGALEAHVLPTPDSFQLSGPLGIWTNGTGFFADVPVGKYDLASRFGALTESAVVEVYRNQTNRVDVAARIGALELSSEPPGGEFDLISDRFRESGSFPAQYGRLPAGEYQLIAKKPGYERKIGVVVRKNETNRVVVKFVYGTARISTEPAGARVYWSGTLRGVTPLTLTSVVPGTHEFVAKLDGYDDADITITIEGDATATRSITLVNTRYRNSMASARVYLDREQFADAVRSLEEAIAAIPGDAVATGLLTTARHRVAVDRITALATRGNLDEALVVANSALADAPGDPAILALQSKISAEKAQLDKQRAGERFRQLVDGAKAEGARQNFEKALSLIAEAKRINPGSDEISPLESSFRERQSTALAEQKKREAVAALQAEAQKAFANSLRNEPNAGVFALQSWKTTKSNAETLAAFQTVGKESLFLKMRELSVSSPALFTAKMGPLIDGPGGSYFHVGAVTYAEGDTVIFFKHFVYTLNGPQTDASQLQFFLEPFRKKLSAALGGDLK